MINLINELESKHIYISLSGDKLELSYDNEIDNEVVEKIKDNKEQLITFLKKYSNTKEYEEIEVVEERDYYPLSDAQKRLWLLSQLGKNSLAWNMPVIIPFNGECDYETLQKTMHSVIRRHEILRTVFQKNDDGEVYQKIIDIDDFTFELKYKDFSLEENGAALTQSFIENDKTIVFDLEKGPLLRATLFKILDNEYVFYLNIHHIISDGWSLEVLEKDIKIFYQAYSTGNTPNLDKLRIQYKDYAIWQLDQSKEGAIHKHKDYWLHELSGELPKLDVPHSKIRPRVLTHNGFQLRTFLGEELTRKLKLFSHKQGGSLFTNLLAVWNVLFYRYLNQKDIIIGTLVAGREQSELENQIGYYVNTLALRNKINPEESFLDFYDRVRKNTLESFSHQIYPFNKLTEELNVVRDLSTTPIFDVLLVLHNIKENKKQYKELQQEDLERIHTIGKVYSKFPIEIEFKELDNYMSFDIKFNSDIYREKDIKSLMNHYKKLLLESVEKSYEKICELNFFTEAEKKNLLCDFNQTEAFYEKNKSIIEIFETQIDKTPDNTAIIYKENRLTFKELNIVSNKYAEGLQHIFGLKPNDRIVVSLEHDQNLMPVLLAIKKTGAVYVPVDPQMPSNKVNEIKQLSKSIAVLNTDRFLELEKYCLGINTTEFGKTELPKNDIEFIIYTSGSTGKPKGVLLKSSSVLNRMNWMWNHYPFKEGEVCCAKTSISFVDHIWEFFGPLLKGVPLVFYKKNEILNIPDFIESLSQENVSRIVLVPSLLKTILAYPDVCKEKLTSLNLWISSGEALKGKDVEGFYDTFQRSDVRLINIYGSTEVTADATYYDTYLDYNAYNEMDSLEAVSIKNIENGSVPIGKPIENVKAYILDEFLNILPIGVKGEICISGDCVSAGYIDDKEGYSSKFIKNPFNKNEILFKTGDIGKRLSDGNIAFITRKDDQVKIRGHRIELKEVENVLSNINGVHATTVIARKVKEEEAEIIAYVISDNEVSDIRTSLMEHLPSYMIPSYLVYLERFPKTSSGKINKKELPNPEEDNILNKVIYEAPKNEMERQVVSIWQEVLKRENISMKDDFFFLGGHSLKATYLINEYEKAFDVTLQLNEIFAHSTVESHVGLIKKAPQKVTSAIQKVKQQESYPLSDTQHRLWILSQLGNNIGAYNMPFETELRGDFDVVLFQKAIKESIQRHEILRTVFKENQDGEVRQWVIENGAEDFVMNYFDYRNDIQGSVKAKCHIEKDSYEPFNLETGPLLRVSLIRLEEKRYILYYNMHHIISDGISLEVLRQDTLTFYEAYLTNSTPDILPLEVQYKDYASWRLKRLKSDQFKIYKNYWLHKLSGRIPRLHFFEEKERPRIKTYSGNSLTTYISENAKESLEEFCFNHKGSLFVGTLLIWKILFHKYTSQNDITIGTPQAGRDHKDLKNQIGCYINTLILRNEINPNDNFITLFSKVKESVFESFNHKEYPFDQIVEDLQVRREINRNPLFDIMFSFHNTSENNIDIQIDNLDEIIDEGDRQSKLDMIINFAEHGKYIYMNIDYDTALYEKSFIKELMKSYKTLIDELMNNPNTPIKNIDIKKGYKKDLKAVNRKKLMNLLK